MSRTGYNYRLLIFLLFTVGLTVNISMNVNAEETRTSLSGRVIDDNGNPVEGLKLALKPVKFSIGINHNLFERAPFISWPRAVTGSDGSFFFNNIDPVSSHFVMFPEHRSDYEIISIKIDNITFHSTAFHRSMPIWYGKLIFSVSQGEHLDNMVINVKMPRMRISGRVVFKDGTPLKNEKISLSIRSQSYQTHPGGGISGSRGKSIRDVQTDNEGYFLSYYPKGAGEFNLIITYQGMTAKAEKFNLEVGESKEALVFVLDSSKVTYPHFFMKVFVSSVCKKKSGKSRCFMVEYLLRKRYFSKTKEVF